MHENFLRVTFSFGWRKRRKSRGRRVVNSCDGLLYESGKGELGSNGNAMGGAFPFFHCKNQSPEKVMGKVVCLRVCVCIGGGGV